MYRINQYKDRVTGKDEATQKQYELAEKLSKGFTIQNKTALEIDKLLMELLDLEGQQEENEPVTTAQIKQKVKSNGKPDMGTDIEKSFAELFEALKNQSSEPAFNEEKLRETLQDMLKELKISYEELDSELQRMLESKPRIIQYELPDIKAPAFKKPDIPVFQQIVDDIMLGNNVMLVGGAGTGKTFMAENLVAKMALARPHITINCSQWTSPTEIIGGQTMDGYVEGKLIEAWKNGYVLILDELPKIDPNTAGLFNDALAKTKIQEAVIFNGRKESFVKHKDFACIATGNIYPDKESMTYGANNKQDLSLLDRFSGSVYFIEKNPSIEKEILQNDMVWSICDKVRSVIEEMKYEAQLSLRFMQNARDAFSLEMIRLKGKGKNNIKADEGKTFKSAIDSYLSTFTGVQQKNIKDKIRYNEIFPGYEYREFDTKKTVY